VPGDVIRLRWTRAGAAMEGRGTIAAPAPMVGPVRMPAKPADAPKDGTVEGKGASGEAPPK
jgi:hypothetical protein